jgi:5-methylcytosine-specific restriction protein A
MRHEFTAAAIREADERAQGRCEATGQRYGLEPGERCNADLSATGRQRDHFPRGAHDPHPETRTAANCVVCCPRCNQYAANHTDKAVEAKIKRVRRKHGLEPDTRKPRRKIPRPKNFKWAKRPMSKRQA